MDSNLSSAAYRPGSILAEARLLELTLNPPPPNSHAKSLDWPDVRLIRKLWKEDEDLTQQMLADEYGVTRQTIHCIVTYKTWREPQPTPPRMSALTAGTVVSSAGDGTGVPVPAALTY